MATNARRPSARDVSDKAKQAGDSAQDAGQSVHQSGAFRTLVMVGLICYGVIHVLLGWLAIQLAIGGEGRRPPGAP